MGADRAAAHPPARGIDVAVALDERGDDGVVGIGPGNARRDVQVPHLVQPRHVEHAVQRRLDGEQHVRQCKAAQGVVAVAEREPRPGHRQPRAVDARDVLLRPAAERHRVGLVGADGDAGFGARRSPIRGIQQDVVARCVGQLAVVLVARIRVVLGGPVGRRLVAAGGDRSVERAVCEELPRQQRAARRHGRPALVRFPPGDRRIGRYVVARQPARGGHVFDAGLETVGAGLGGGIHGEAAAAVETHRVDAAAHEDHLIDVVARWLRRQRSEHRQRDVDAVEAVDVVLPAASGGRSAHGILGDLHPRRELDEIPVVAPERRVVDHVRIQGVGKRRAVARRDARCGDDDLLHPGFAPSPQIGREDGRLIQQHRRSQRARLAAGRRHDEAIGTRHEFRQRESTCRIRAHGARAGHRRAARHDDDVRNACATVDHRALDAAGLLGLGIAGEDDQDQRSDDDPCGHRRLNARHRQAPRHRPGWEWNSPRLLS